MNNRYLILAALVLPAALSLTTCRDAIFATIENEKKADTNSLSLTLTVADIEPSVHNAGTTVYTVAAGAIFQGALTPVVAGEITWDPNSDSSKRPYNPTGLYCNAMAMLGNFLYGGFIDSSGEGRMYRSTDRTVSTPSFNGGTSIPLPPGGQVTLLRAVNGVLFRVVATPTGSPFNYVLDYSTDDGVSWNSTDGLPSGGTITGVGLNGGAYWVTAGSTIFTAAPSPLAPGTFTAITGGPSIGTDQINGLFADANYVFVLTKTKLWYKPTAGGWAPPQEDTNSTGNVGFLSVGGPVNSASLYLVGSDGSGYYTLDAQSGTFSRFDDSTITLSVASVANILVDNAGPQQNVLLGTNGQGVWRAVFDSNGQLLSGTNQYWIHE